MESFTIVEFTERFVVFVEQDAEGRWYALTKASPYFCLEGPTLQEALTKAGQCLDFCLNAPESEARAKGIAG